MTRSIQPEEVLTAADVHDPKAFMSFAAQQIGVPKPIGVKARGLAVRRIKDEMEEQHWSWKHLTAAVRYMKAKKIKAKTIDYIFYFVSDAIRDGFLPRPSITSWEILEQKVTDAIYAEDDPIWTRRLISARGDSLALVMSRWERERLPLLSIEPKTWAEDHMNVQG